MPVGPNTAFALLIFGILGIYCEFIWPGRVIFGLIGAALAITASYFLFRSPLAPFGLVFLALAALFFIVEASWGPYFLSGVFGTVAVIAGFCLLFPAPRRLESALSIPLSAFLGVVSTLLTAAAKRARRNKWADLKPSK